MPLDILYEIFCYMTPADLLKLSRMSKAFRRILMSSSSVSIWRTARENTGLPECPPDMIEPQWANLAYSPHCHYCFANGIRTVEWRFKKRICSKCAKQHLSVTFNMPEVGGVRGVLLLPHQLKRGKLVYITADYEKLRSDISQLSEDTNGYIQQKKQEVTQLMAHARKCEEWVKHQNDDRSMELDRLREERKNAIVEKLKALGWEKDLESIRLPDSLGDLKQVRMPQRLTERIWSNIQGPILEFMAKMRKKRIDGENQEIIMQRKRAAMTVLQEYKNDRLPYSEIMPEAVDFCDMQPVKSIIDQPLDVSVDAASFLHLIPEFQSLFATWRNGIHLQLCNLLKQPEEPDLYYDIFGLVSLEQTRCVPKTDKEALEMLSLASTVFACMECGAVLSTLFGVYFKGPLFYPEVLGHTCLTRAFSSPFMFTDYPVDPSTELRRQPVMQRTKWSPRFLTLNDDMRIIAEALIEESGLDPNMATATDMDERNLFYACWLCVSPHNDDFTAPVYKWRDAIRHQVRCHYHSEVDWYIADEDEFDDRYVEVDEEDEQSKRSIWCCARCRDTPEETNPMPLSLMKNHYAIQHQIHGELNLNRDYFETIDLKRQCSLPLRMFLN
ncbi:hypothetical protein AX14_012443 [Amanita brunnescens Koide BX004]|nr:hypothetical protein AX14_012443 [Amanita brunnescens Koide BX004]